MQQDRTVLQAKRYEIFQCRPDATLLQAARKMVEDDISALVVTDAAGSLAGVITRTDLVRARVTEPGWAAQRVEQFMTRDVVTTSAQDQMAHVAQMILENHIHRVVIVREEGGKRRPVAVVSEADVVYDMVKNA